MRSSGSDVVGVARPAAAVGAGTWRRRRDAHGGWRTDKEGRMTGFSPAHVVDGESVPMASRKTEAATGDFTLGDGDAPASPLRGDNGFGWRSGYDGFGWRSDYSETASTTRHG
jgi:hypothetical protein